MAGREAILTIKKNGVVQEKVVMHTLPDKQAMHAMMVAKGFVRKSPEEMEQITSDAQAVKLKEEESKAESIRKMKERREKAAAGLNFEQQHAKAAAKNNNNNAAAAVRKGTNLNDIRQSEEMLRMALLSRASASSTSSASSFMIFIPVIAGVMGMSAVAVMWRQNRKRRSSPLLTGQIRLS